MDLYARIDKVGRKHYWKSKIDSKARHNATEIIIGICDPKHKIKDVQKDFEVAVEAASVPSNGNNLSVNTRSMQKLIKSLNSPKTSMDVKKSFIKLLGLDTITDPKLKGKGLEEREYNKQIEQFQFTKEDFKAKIKELDQTRKLGTPSKGLIGVQTIS